ncbi:BolA family protein [Brytella acorum]|uniref:BolA family transcriptional regulator n=1 Tax=Brytella acorum TaxID=2959299 RepID=A0AA35VA27_9PROT|nr:BolA family protein [Brytella acorum]MDF3624450.1 BolA family transcriptional regulator [Brytella acorum]CAI9119700.1 BolA family transcriptional regulator [Brytella acorum]
MTQTLGATEALAPRAQRIVNILREKLSPSVLELKDDSKKHAHHHARIEAGEDGETHFVIRLRSAKFNGITRVARHRLVNELLADEFRSGLHSASFILQDEKSA